MATKAMEYPGRESRLRALQRLLEYALAESEELGLANVDKLLGAATLAISDELDNVKALPSNPDASCHRRPSRA